MNGVIALWTLVTELTQTRVHSLGIVDAEWRVAAVPTRVGTRARARVHKREWAR